MRILLSLVAATLASPAFALEEGKAPLEVKINVKGMSCPDGCAPLIVKGLSKLENVAGAKLVDFKKGLFSLKMDSAKPVSPLALQDAIGTDYVLGRIEAAMTGTVSKGKRGLELTTASGVRYGLKEGKPASKAACKACPSAKTAKSEKAACDAKTVPGKTLAQIGAWLGEGKQLIRVVGDFDEFCPGKVVLNVRSAKVYCDGETTNN